MYLHYMLHGHGSMIEVTVPHSYHLRPPIGLIDVLLETGVNRETLGPFLDSACQSKEEIYTTELNGCYPV